MMASPNLSEILLHHIHPAGLNVIKFRHAIAVLKLVERQAIVFL
jgi:hypothetical protein